MAKGGQYERDLCRELSLWLSGGRHDDWLWRSSQSGGRATTRAKSGKRTTGHCGDLCCTCKEAEWFTKLVTVEAKRGYNRSAMMADLLDRDVWPAGKERKGTMLGMIEQAQDAAKRAKTPYWMLIHRRDKRQALVYLPRRFYIICDLIDYLLVEGFQKVRRRRVKLDPGVTVLIGDSATGKSSTLRALKWLLLNVPQGDRYVGDWGKAKRTRVEAKVDGRKLVRKRKGRLNAYYSGGRQLKFDHVSKGKPPKAVQDLVNVEAANFQGQHDPPLWFTLPAAEVSRRLNNVVNLRTIDAALKSAASRVRRANAKVEVSRDRLREADAAREAAGWAAELATDLDRLSYLDTQRAELAARASTIDSAVSAVSRAALGHQNAAESIVALKPLVELARTRVELGRRCRRILELAEQVDTAERLSIDTPRLDHLFKLQAGRVRLAAKCRKIGTLLHAIDFGALELSALVDQKADLERRLKEMEGATCPFCGQPIRSQSCAATSTLETPSPSPVERAGVNGMTPKRVTAGS